MMPHEKSANSTPNSVQQVLLLKIIIFQYVTEVLYIHFSYHHTNIKIVQGIRILLRILVKFIIFTALLNTFLIETSIIFSTE